MKIELVEQLEIETERALEKAKDWRPESDEYADTMEQVRENFKVLIQESKTNNDYSIAIDNQIAQKDLKQQELAMQAALRERELELQKREKDLKQQELISTNHVEAEKIREAKKDRWVGVVKEGAKIIVPAAVYLLVSKVCLQYETTGAVTSVIGKSLINKMRPDA